MIPLGGARSRGLGVVRLTLTEMLWANPQNRDELLQYMQDLVTGTMQSYIFNQPEVEAHRANWALALLEDLTISSVPA
jgi:CRISPR/Cas system CSM-associated protein Csm3 (group 7 of RAMP superfamily)